MKHYFILLFTLACSFAKSQTAPFTAGVYVKLNSSALKVSSTTDGFRPLIQSNPQWSAGAGFFYNSPDWNRFSLEAQAGIEANGSGQMFYYDSGTGEVSRIYDRYRIVPISLLIRRSITEKNSFYISAGIKTSFVLGFSSRHTNVASPPAGTIILNPEVEKMFQSVVGEFGWVRPRGDIALTLWHAFTPIIDDAKVEVLPLGLAVTVKADIL